MCYLGLQQKWKVCVIDNIAFEKRNLIKELRERERCSKQLKIGRINKASYNKKYKDMVEEGNERKYLERLRLTDLRNGNGVNVLIRLRCDNMEENNKYWLKEDVRECTFYGLEKDNFENFIRKYTITIIITKG